MQVSELGRRFSNSASTRHCICSSQILSERGKFSELLHGTYQYYGGCSIINCWTVCTPRSTQLKISSRWMWCASQYHGGTNFERTAVESVTTSYDYDAPLDEFGCSLTPLQNSLKFSTTWWLLKPQQPCNQKRHQRVNLLRSTRVRENLTWAWTVFAGDIRQPKWGHLKDLHAALKLCEPALVAVDTIPPPISFGSNQEVIWLPWLAYLPRKSNRFVDNNSCFSSS